MTIAHKYNEHLRRTKYKCDICEKIDFWGNTWRHYSSEALVDEYPEEVPCACSDVCQAELNRKIDTGEIKLPVLHLTAAGYNISKARQGY